MSLNFSVVAIDLRFLLNTLPIHFILLLLHLYICIPKKGLTKSQNYQYMNAIRPIAKYVNGQGRDDDNSDRLRADHPTSSEHLSIGLVLRHFNVQAQHGTIVYILNISH